MVENYPLYSTPISLKQKKTYHVNLLTYVAYTRPFFHDTNLNLLQGTKKHPKLCLSQMGRNHGP